MIYRRPGIYSSCPYSRYSVYAGGPEVYNMTYGPGQQWTNENVPAGVETLHDFGDGLGPVPAIPVDSASLRCELVGIKKDYQYREGTDSASLRCELVGIKKDYQYREGTDSASLRCELVGIKKDYQYREGTDSASLRCELVNVEPI